MSPRSAVMGHIAAFTRCQRPPLPRGGPRTRKMGQRAAAKLLSRPTLLVSPERAGELLRDGCQGEANHRHLFALNTTSSTHLSHNDPYFRSYGEENKQQPKYSNGGQWHRKHRPTFTLSMMHHKQTQVTDQTLLLPKKLSLSEGSSTRGGRQPENAFIRQRHYRQMLQGETVLKFRYVYHRTEILSLHCLIFSCPY